MPPDPGKLGTARGCGLELVDEGFDIGIRESWTTALADVKAKGGKPYAIPAGASVHKFGGLGYVGFAEEVRAQEKEMGVKFDFIVVCTVTGSTHAGMVVGFGADGRGRNVIGIDASKRSGIRPIAGGRESGHRACSAGGLFGPIDSDQAAENRERQPSGLAAHSISGRLVRWMIARNTRDRQ